jgi:TRAP-type C4-dicarboxylate transport system substrate-binding protein
VEELTEGRVKVDIYDSQTLVKVPETFDALNRGIADISSLPLALFQSGLPWWGVEFLPGVIKDFQGAHDAAKNGMLDIYQEAFSSKGMNIKIASLYCPTMCCIMTKDRRVAVPEDLKGLKIQCAGAGEATVIEALGGVPVVMPHAETYEAIMRGMVDGTHFGIAGFAYKWQEPCDYLCMYSLGGAYAATIVSELSLAEMSTTDQGIVLEVVRHYALQDELSYAVGQERILEKHYKPNLKEVVYPTPEESKKWEETLAPLIDEWLAKAGPEGEKALDILRQYNP